MGLSHRAVRHVVYTADDFGLSASVNEAVELAHRAGTLHAASLMVAEIDRRGLELAVCAALGASPGRLVAASCVEGLMLGVSGTAVGIAWASMRVWRMRRS